MYSVVLSQFLVVYTIDPQHKWRLNLNNDILLYLCFQTKFFLYACEALDV